MNTRNKIIIQIIVITLIQNLKKRKKKKEGDRVGLCGTV